eukprot:gene17071-23363_t
MASSPTEKHLLLLGLCDLSLPKSTQHEELVNAFARASICLSRITQCRTSAAYSWIHSAKLSVTDAHLQMKSITGRCLRGKFDSLTKTECFEDLKRRNGKYFGQKKYDEISGGSVDSPPELRNLVRQLEGQIKIHIEEVPKEEHANLDHLLVQPARQRESSHRGDGWARSDAQINWGSTLLD